jgi:hypothetical protein
MTWTDLLRHLFGREGWSLSRRESEDCYLSLTSAAALRHRSYAIRQSADVTIVFCRGLCGAVAPENVTNYLLWWNYSVNARFLAHGTPALPGPKEHPMNGIIYLVGLIVVIMFILSFLGLR